MTCRVQAGPPMKVGWLVGSTGREGLTAILLPVLDPTLSVPWCRIVAYTCDRGEAESLVARLNETKGDR